MAALLAAAAAACSAFSSESDPGTAPPAEAGADGSDREGGPAVGADGAVPDDADAGPQPRFCETAGQHDFCADFDPGDIGTSKLVPDRAGTGTVVLVPSAPMAPSPPSVLESKLETSASDPAGRHAAAQILAAPYAASHENAGTYPALAASFSMRVTRADATPAAFFALASAPIALGLRSTPFGLQVIAAYPNAVVVDLPLIVPMDTWVRFAISVPPRGAGTDNAPVSVQMVQPGGTSLASPAPPAGVVGLRSFQGSLGLFTTKPNSGAWTVQYDSVTYDWR